MITVYVQASTRTLSEVRTFVRESGLERPRIGRLAVRVQPYRPYLTFTFQDEVAATAFRFRFNVKVVHPGTIAEIDAADRDRLEKGIRRLSVSPETEAHWRRRLNDLTSVQLTEGDVRRGSNDVVLTAQD